jgi:hypothetical protein
MSADPARHLRIERGFERRVLCDGFGITFHGKPLHGLQSSSYRFLIWFGPPHLGIETLIDLAQSGIVGPNARQDVFGLLRRSHAGWFYRFLFPVLVSISIHDSGRCAYWVILAQADGISTPGELDLPFRFRGHAIASCRAIPPGSDGSQEVAVARRSGALQDQGTTHEPVRTDDEAYLHLHSCSCQDQQRIGRG